MQKTGEKEKLRRRQNKNHFFTRNTLDEKRRKHNMYFNFFLCTE